MSAKKRIALIMQTDDLNTGGFQQRIQITAPGTVHQLHSNLDLALCQDIEINKLADLRKIKLTGIDRRASVLTGQLYFRFPAVLLKLRDACFQLAGDLRGSSRPVPS